MRAIMPKKSKKSKRMGSRPMTKVRALQVIRAPKARVPRRLRRSNAASSLSNGRLMVSHDGDCYLKSAIAPWDFPGCKPQGIPDNFAGPTFVIRSKELVPFNLTTQTLFILLAPTPGISCWTSQAAATIGSLGGNPFPDFVSLFGTNANTNNANVNRFRVVSHTARIKPSSAVLNNAGIICASRMPGVTMTQSINSTTGAGGWYLGGVQNQTFSNISSNPGAYVGHVNEGMSLWSVQGEENVPFTPIWDGGITALAAQESVSGASVLTFGSPGAGIPGFGTMVPTLIAVAGSNTNTSIVLEVEMCVEYQATAGSLQAEMSAPSPPLDQEALDLYKYAALNLPIAVPTDKNAGFWDMFLKIAGAAAPIVGAAVGPLGRAVGSGIGALATGLRSLII